MDNARRLYLITMKYWLGLDEQQAAELARLQEEKAKEVDAVASLPLGELERLESLADFLEAREGWLSQR